MTIDGAQVLVDGPVRTPLPYGLLSVSQVPVDSDDTHWKGGIRYETDDCGFASITTDSCAVTGGAIKSPTGTWITRGAQPLTVYTLPVCAPVGTYENYEPRVQAVLTSGEARAVEKEFWTGANGTLPHLAANTPVSGTGFDTSVVIQTAATVIVTGAVDILEGIALLEEALATCYGNEGVIHIPPIAVAHAKDEDLIDKDGTRLRSPSGHLVAAGAGYTGSSPAGVAPSGGIYWLYATGAVTVRRGPIEVTRPIGQAVDRSRNDVFLVAERTYVISWDCCHFAIPVRMGGEITGAVGTAA